MKKYRDPDGCLYNINKVETKQDIALIRKKGFFGTYVDIGDYYYCIGGSDGGFLVFHEGDNRIVNI